MITDNPRKKSRNWSNAMTAFNSTTRTLLAFFAAMALMIVVVLAQGLGCCDLALDLERRNLEHGFRCRDVEQDSDHRHDKRLDLVLSHARSNDRTAACHSGKPYHFAACMTPLPSHSPYDAVAPHP
jgi:hypothetical protein